jgi:hypothetical protein
VGAIVGPRVMSVLYQNTTVRLTRNGVVVTLVTSLLRLGARKFVSLMGKRESSSFQRNSGKARHLD